MEFEALKGIMESVVEIAARKINRPVIKHINQSEVVFAGKKTIISVIQRTVVTGSHPMLREYVVSSIEPIGKSGQTTFLLDINHHIEVDQEFEELGSVVSVCTLTGTEKRELGHTIPEAMKHLEELL